jgi:cytochrome c-type biogenesis protein CcmF
MGLILILLMGVGPLISWRKASIEHLLKNFLYPSIMGLLTAVFLFFLGVREGVALISFGLCAFVAATIFIEFYRGTKVRAKRGEDYLIAFFRLISRNRRRYGGYIVHLGVILIVIGITASSAFVTQKEATLRKGESMNINHYTLKFDGLTQYTTAMKHVTAAKLSVFNSERNLGVVIPEKNVYIYEGNRDIDNETEVALRSTFMDDLYIILTNFNDDGAASFRVLINPMVSWIWVGGIVLALGAIVIMYPSLGQIREEAVVRYTVEAHGEGTAKL